MGADGLASVLRALSSLARTGWMLRGVPPSIAESVASHAFYSSVIALELALEARRSGLKVDPYKSAVIALVHDMGEAIIGDISRRAGLAEAKEEAEAEAFKMLPVSPEVKEAYEEFKSMATIEASIARIAELLATHAKALEYSAQGFDVRDIRDSTISEAARIAREWGLSEALDNLLKRLSGPPPRREAAQGAI